MAETTRLADTSIRYACANPDCNPDGLAMPHDFAKRMLDVLTLSDRQVVSVDIAMRAGEPVRMTIGRFVTRKEMGEMVELLEEFQCKLTAKPPAMSESSERGSA